LSISFMGHGGFDVQVVGDERVAGFMALGMSQTDGLPTILVCTSGSALLNYAPAVSEACYQRIPMLVLSADRPEEWVDQMEGQTMRQQHALKNFVNREFQLPQEASDGDRLWYSDRLINEAITACNYPQPGAVHINIPLKEPLYGTQDSDAVTQMKVIEPMIPAVKELSENDWQVLIDELAGYAKVMLIMGMASNEVVELSLLQHLKASGMVIMNETSSNAAGEGVYSWIDRSIAAIPSNEEEAFLPELIITCAGPLISKRIKTLLRGHHPEAHWHIDACEAQIDLFQSLTRAIYSEPQYFLSELSQRMGGLDQTYSTGWERLMKSVDERHETYLSNAPFSDLKSYEQILASIPHGADVQMANSAAVRYVQVFPNRADITYHGNRGVSGIEGCTSTAMGMAMVKENPVVLLTGDMAFRYDANAFWLSKRAQNLKCIVINNGGGGIFRIIPGPESTAHLETAFEAHQDNGAKGIAELYDIPYLSADDEETLAEALNECFADDRTLILEVFTPRELNAEVLRSYFEYLKNQQ
jgi:2-succinyl-5-enolpyruvyl-6-hydroxy-3-cyclohexene-1-carboxylate synthase